MRALFAWVFSTLLLLMAFGARADVAIPPLQARVTDLTGTLEASQRQALEQKLAAFEQAKGSQIAVLIVPTTQPETIEQYSIRVAEQWKLGRKSVDDGLLLILARNDRALRIEVGYGLEGVVPDAVANRVIDEVIVPHLRQGDYYAGIDAGVDQLIKLVDGEPLPPPARRSGSAQDERMQLLWPLLFVGLGVSQLLRRVFGAGLGALAAGGGIFALVWLVSGTLLVALFFAAIAAVLTLFGVAPFLGGWHSGGGGGYRGGGGGGFGGGGGGFGGGGASGRW